MPGKMVLKAEDKSSADESELFEVLEGQHTLWGESSCKQTVNHPFIGPLLILKPEKLSRAVQTKHQIISYYIQTTGLKHYLVGIKY